MTVIFDAVPGADAEMLDRIARHTPLSPFNTSAYAAAASRTGMTPVSLAVMDEHNIVDACLGLLSTTAGMRLELPSIPRLREPQAFWRGVAEYCERQRVTDLIVDTFASEVAHLPEFTRRSDHRQRCEYVISLDEGFENRLAKDHRYNIRKAVRNGIRLERTSDAGACETHLELMHSSTSRRRARGETVETAGDGGLHAAILETGAGELFQALSEDRVLSSILVLRGEAGAYYHSGGTRPEGMKAGASQFVLFETARQLAAEGISAFNLGGADEDAEGLRNFKLRFGARAVPLEAATYLMVPAYRRAARRLIRRLERLPRKLRRQTS